MKIGILGAGQLGQMLALAGYPLGNRFSFLDTSANASADIGCLFTHSEADSALADFLAQVDCVTYEFEHLPLPLVKSIAEQKPLFPSVKALQVCQNREAEKALFDQLSIPVADYRLVNSADELAQACQELMTAGAQAVVAKSITEGYDGKGQAVLRRPDEAASAWQRIGHSRLIVEAFVDFVREVSIIAVRGRSGDVVFYPVAENHHVEGILRYSLAPVPNFSQEAQVQAEAYIHALLDELEYVGVLTLELFQQADGCLLANEMAPRVHNSGHWTQNGSMTSQFENHLRAVQGLPLGSTHAKALTCMINIIGKNGDYEDILKLEDTHLHLYGKSERAGRKLGHINLVAGNIDDLKRKVEQVAQLLPDAPAPEFSF
ncbi:5-(carboxyamino)imidazole ribonucleotide synthase [Nitrincola tibetensis]|uniref:N5-carboxyaminoimidazole ribonucleotide synthase n=1 Tax=Nitrincola tibetensis TaxID=2219697 RepID=A0A364NLL9_9GAMM|nr:5-(carboxyamino)imidazole ribonucleotide synthase [Nitrincola tibetensis]RAU18009.1 5-(carboxyamino)imidazole ribonucleotide synthase [Nitrincola tibetensis]